MILDGLFLTRQKIVITSDRDLLKDCYLSECEIVAAHPLSVYLAVVREAKNEIKELPREDKSAFSVGCFFDECTMPSAFYDGCYFHSSKPKVNQDE